MMAIRRRKKEREFTQIDNAAILNKQMGLKAKGLLMVMMSRPADWDFYMDWLEGQSRDGKEAHQSAMKELETLGYVVRIKVQGKGGRFTWDYEVDDEIHGNPGLTIGGKARHGENSTTTGFTTDGSTVDGSATDGKPAASNTDFTKTDLTNMELTKTEISGGVLDITGNARAKHQATSVAVINPPSVTTTGGAALPKIPVVKSDDGPGGAGTPDGVNGEPPELTDEDTAQLFGSQDDQATAPEQVPAGAAALDAVLGQAVGEHDPQATRIVLVRNLGGEKRLNTLMEEVPPGLAKIHRTRRDWITKISPERAEELVLEARGNPAQHPWTAITELLDREIGARIVRGSAQTSPGSNGNAGKVTLPGQKLTAPPEVPMTGSSLIGTWVLKARPEIQVQVVNVTDGEATLSDGTTLRTADLIVRYQRLK